MSATAEPVWYVYLLRCADSSLYTGITTNPERRLRQHNGELAGGAQYTRGRRPVTLVWTETWRDRSGAQRREAAVRRLPRGDKLRLAHRAPRAPSLAAPSAAARDGL